MRFLLWLKSFFNKKENILDKSINTSLPDFQYLWDTTEYDSNRIKEIESTCEKIINNKTRYKYVENLTGVPWQLISALHYREASLSFNTCLHNGDKLPGPTTHVPRGRGPFENWETAAVDAIKYDGLDKVKYIDVISQLVMAEKFNGMGYRKHGILSPYIWAASNHSNEIGKYKDDGLYSASAKEDQLGIAVILKYLSQKQA